MLQRLQDRSFPKRLWQQQEGKCPVCGQLIDEASPYIRCKKCRFDDATQHGF
jgi:tRNA(Ile2) C34 agmatinyltransferase TiaS